MSRGVGLFALVFGLALPSAIGVGGCTIACTEIGCVEPLVVELVGDVPETYIVRFEFAGELPVEFACSEAPCPGVASIPFAPVEVTISVRDGAGEEVARQVFEPSYTTSRPNGANCPPECLNASVALTIE